MRKVGLLQIDIRDMDKVLSSIETAAYALKGCFLAMWIFGLFVLNIQYPDSRLWWMMGISLCLVSAFVTLWIVWGFIKSRYNRWVKKSLAMDSLKFLDE